MIDKQKPFIVGLAGGSGSGKTTLANIIATDLPWETAIVSLDQFYNDLSHLTLGERNAVNFDHPDSIDVRSLAGVLQKLQGGEIAQIPIYDFTVHNQSGNFLDQDPTPVILVEGMHALSHLELCELYDLTIFLDIDEKTRWQRKLKRDVRERGRTFDQVEEMWRNFTRPMHKIYVHPNSTRANLLFTDTFAPEAIRAITKTIQQKIGFTENATGLF